MLYSIFWAISWRLNFIRRRFGTPVCFISIGGVSRKNNRDEIVQTALGPTPSWCGAKFVTGTILGIVGRNLQIIVVHHATVTKLYFRNFKVIYNISKFNSHLSREQLFASHLQIMIIFFFSRTYRVGLLWLKLHSTRRGLFLLAHWTWN